MGKARFEWDEDKDRGNRRKHGISFAVVQYAFADPDRVLAEDTEHSEAGPRYFCFGRVGVGVLTVRFTYRESVIRIYGAGYWRKGKQIYEKANRVR